MNIRIYYEDGRVRSFSTDAQTTPDPFRAEAPQGSGNIMTEYNVRLDRLLEEGLFLDVNWHNLLRDGAVDEADELWSQPLKVSHHEPGRRIRLASADAMMKMAKIVIDNETVVWKEVNAETGEVSLINGIQFNMIDRIYNNVDASIKEKAFVLFNILQALHPDKDKESICKIFGYTTTLLNDSITSVEAQQVVRKAINPPAKSTDDTSKESSELDLGSLAAFAKMLNGDPGDDVVDLQSDENVKSLPTNPSVESKTEQAAVEELLGKLLDDMDGDF
jgi:hypothetical protein